MTTGNISQGEKLPDFLKRAEHQLDSLERLSTLVTLYTEAERDIADLEEQLTSAKERATALGREEIPTLLLANNLSEIKMKDGRKVTIKEDISVTITDDSLFHKFLTDRKEDDLIKLHFDFSRMPVSKQKALFKYLMDNEYDYESKRNVHHMTLKKYFRELLGLDGKDGGTINKNLVEPFAKVFTYHTTTVK